MTYRSNVVRYLDKQNNKSFIQFEDEYDQEGILKKISFSFIGVGTSSGNLLDRVFDFDNRTLNGNPFPKHSPATTKEEFKAEILNYFNKNSNVKLICAKETCNDPNCKPHLSIGNKITQSENTKQPYFSSNCAGIDYVETPEHLNAKINIHKLLMEKSAYYRKKDSNIKIENVEIEKTFSLGNGQERRSDVYYEKHYTKTNGEVVVEKFSIEVQRNNISYEELLERTQWDKANGIATFWIVVDKIFERRPEAVESLSKKDFNIPLLKLIGFSMNNYKDRFFIYDDSIKKILPLTVQQPNISSFNNLDDTQQKKVKSQFSLDNLYIISNIKDDKGYYKLLPYQTNRLNHNIGNDILSFGVFSNTKTIIHKNWDQKNKKFEFVHFLKLGQLPQKQNNTKKMYKM